MQASSALCSRSTRPLVPGRRTVVTFSSANGVGPSSMPSRPGGASRFSVSSADEVPSDAEGDVPSIRIRPSGGAFRGIPDAAPGTAGAVGSISFERPGGGCMRFNLPASSTVVIASGPSSSVDAPSRFSRPAGGAARMFPSGVGAAAFGGNGGGGPTSGDGSGSGGGGVDGSGGAPPPSPADEPLGFSSLAPWALLYLGVCAGLYWAQEAFIRKPKQAAAAAAAPVRSCCKKGCSKSSANK